MQKTKRFAVIMLLRCHYYKVSRTGKKTIFAHPADAFYSAGVRFLLVKPCTIRLMAVCRFASEEFAHLWQVFLGPRFALLLGRGPGSRARKKRIERARARLAGRQNVRFKSI